MAEDEFTHYMGLDLPYEVMDFRLEYCKALDITHVIMSGTKAYTDIRYKKNRVVAVLDEEGTINYYQNYESPIPISMINKISIITNELEVLEKIREETKSKYPNCINADLSMHDTLEIYANRVSKAQALKNLSSILKIDFNEMAAIGDSENDVDMIEMVGCGIAMQNAVEKVKDVAKYITKSVSEAGVAHAIEKVIPEYEKNYIKSI